MAPEQRPSSIRTSGRAGAIVVGGDYQGLGIVQSLGRHAIPTCVIDDERSIARYSRYATHSVACEDLRDELRLATLFDVGSRLGLDGWVLYPTRDEKAERGYLQALKLLALETTLLAHSFKLSAARLIRILPAFCSV